MRIDITPLPAALISFQNRPWTVAGALSELVDNGFGPGRGNATQVVIEWDATARRLFVFDNGEGMADLSSLFQLGRTVGMSPGDIGVYGAGGTLALLWLGSRVELWTMHRGKCGHVSVDWDQIARGKDFSIVGEWLPASKAPSRLRVWGRGTMIRIQIKTQRKGWSPSNAQRDLSRTYAPALRMGRSLTWQTLGRGSHGDILKLHDPYVALLDERMFGVAVDIPDEPPVQLHATCRIGRDPNANLAESGLAVSFGPRVITTTRDCYRSPQGTQAYQGVGIRGWIELGDGWQPYLTTTKEQVNDQRAWLALMDYIAVQIEPMLIAAEAEKQRMFFDQVNTSLSLMTSGMLARTRPGDLIPDPDGELQLATLHTGNGKVGGNPSEPASAEPRDDAETQVPEYAAAEIDYVVADKILTGGKLLELSKTDLPGGKTAISAFLNIDHVVVKTAYEARPANMMQLTTLVAHSLALELFLNWPVLYRQAIDRKTRGLIDGQKSQAHQVALLTSVLMDRVRV